VVASPPRASAPISLTRKAQAQAQAQGAQRTPCCPLLAPPSSPPLPAQPWPVAGGAQHDDEGVVDVLQDLLLVLDVLHLLQPHHLRLLHDLQREEAVGRVDDRPERWRRLLQCNAQVRRLTEAHAPEGAGT